MGSLLLTFQRQRKKMSDIQDKQQRRLKNSFREIFTIGYHIALPNVNQIESSVDLKPAVYHEPEDEIEQKVAPPKVLQVQQVHHHVEMRTSESGHSNACVRMCGCFFLVLFLIFILIWGFLTITTGDDDRNVKGVTLTPTREPFF